MSDSRRVENDTRDGELVMRALVDTEGKTVPERAEYWLQALARAAHRGRHDTWTAARNRAAEKAGLPRTIAQRIWQRWHSMHDIGGDALLKLMLAYEDLCERNEAAAAAYRAERLGTTGPNHAVDFERARQGVGTDTPRRRAGDQKDEELT